MSHSYRSFHPLCFLKPPLLFDCFVSCLLLPSLVWLCSFYTSLAFARTHHKVHRFVQILFRDLFETVILQVHSGNLPFFAVEYHKIGIWLPSDFMLDTKMLINNPFFTINCGPSFCLWCMKGCLCWYQPCKIFVFCWTRS